MPRKKKKPVKLAVLLFAVLMLMITTAVIYYKGRPHFVHYTDFGIDIPVNYSVHGIDVSRYQGRIRWAEVKKMKVNEVGIQFCFIKATEGLNDADPRFRRNWLQSAAVGIPRGAYHYFNPYANGAAQARHFINEVKLETGDLPPVLDVEQSGNLNREQLQEQVEAWLQLAAEHYGTLPIIYTGAEFYARYFSGKFDQYPLWVAHYLVKNKPRVKRSWLFWQHSESGRVNGIDGNVDFNVFNGSSTAFRNLLLK
jgi:lysozyme